MLAFPGRHSNVAKLKCSLQESTLKFVTERLKAEVLNLYGLADWLAGGGGEEMIPCKCMQACNSICVNGGHMRTNGASHVSASTCCLHKWSCRRQHPPLAQMEFCTWAPAPAASTSGTVHACMHTCCLCNPVSNGLWPRSWGPLA